MFCIPAVEQGNIIKDPSLKIWYDLSDPECNLPGQGVVKDLSGNGTNGTLAGAWNYSTAYNGCINLTNASTSTISFTTVVPAAFTIHICCMSSTDANATLGWVGDAGAWPGMRATNGTMGAQGNLGAGQSYLLWFLWNGGSATAFGGQPGNSNAGEVWNGWTYFPNVYTFSTNGTNNHCSYTNNRNKRTNTNAFTRADSASGTYYVNFDTAVSNRHGIGRICAFIMYNRQLADQEVNQNVQYFFNKWGTQ